MIKLSSYHTHCTFCDGKNTPREMVERAIELGCAEIGFSSHSPLPGEDWCISEANMSSYFDTISALRDEYKDKIKIYIGIEQDVLSRACAFDFDYVIGSVHRIDCGGKFYAVDATVGETRDAILNGCGGDSVSYYKAYFEAVSQVYDKTHCDIIGHFDLLAKFSELDPLISESDPEYIRLRDSAIDALLETPAVFEVNTGAISRGYRTVPYPHPDVLERIKRAGKPVIVTSDTHAVSTLDFMINETAERLLASGIKVITSMDELLEFTRK
jgi:histidinol-phosphatase (PHP family)